MPTTMWVDMSPLVDTLLTLTQAEEGAGKVDLIFIIPSA